MIRFVRSTVNEMIIFCIDLVHFDVENYTTANVFIPWTSGDLDVSKMSWQPAWLNSEDR